MLCPTPLYFKVFGKVSGRLDPNALGIDFSALKTILQTIQDETEIEWKEIFDGFVVSGTFEQMKGMDDVLKNKFKERKGMKKVIPPTHFGESPTISHSRSLPQSNPTESEKCPNVLPEHDQLEVNQSKKEKSSSCTSQDDISATETGVAHGSYLNNNNSIGLHKRPSSTSENSQVGCIEGYKRADRDHSKEEIAFNTNIADKTMSKTRPKLAEHPLHLRQAKISANGNKSSDKNIQDHGETKQHCEDKSLVQCPEINKNESCNVIPQNHHPVPKKDESLGGDLQSNPTESEKCPNVLPEHDQLEVNQSKKEKSSSCTSQDDISATETEVAHGSYLNNNNSIGLHKRPSSTSENSQVGCIEGYKRADRDHSKEEIAFNTNIADKTMSKTRPKLAEHPLHLRQAKISANGNKSSDKNIQDHGETKQHCEDKSLVQCPEINKNESCNVIPQNHHPVPKKDESLGGDLQSTPKLFEKMKSDENSSNMPPPLNKASSEGHSVSEGEATANCHHSHLMQNPEMNKKESCDVIPQYHHPVPKKDESLGGDLQSTPKLFEKMKSDHNSSNMSPALDKASSEGHIETVETNECVSEAEATANGKRRHENSILAESHWKFVTSTGVTVTLLVGDITSQHVDVFLCPANATLSYDEGLSKLIMDKGGQAIKDECLSRVTQSNGHLEDGDTFITCVGNLPCKAVLHAVLPSWNDEMNDEKTTKRQIHKCLLEGLQLASGYRLKSIALPPLGQHFNGVPVEVSAEVIVRVVAAFGKNIGPMHTGIADFYIVCEDGPTIDAFVEEFSSFSFKGQTPFFLSVFLTNHSGKKAESQRTMACQNKDKIDIKETVSVKQTQKEDTKVQSGPLVSSAPALQQEKTPKQETGNEENQNSNPITSVNLGKKLQGNQKEENEKDTTARCERQVCEKKLSFFTSSLIQRTEVSMVRPFEILEVKNAEEKLSEENIKYVVVQDKLPPGKNTTTTLLQDKNLHMNEGEEVTGTCKSVEDTVADITKDIAHNVQWQKIKDMSGQKGDNEDSQDTTIHDLKGIPREQIDGNVSLSDQHTLKSPSSGTNSGIFVTSPTVDDLLNADLGLGIQGLEIFYGEEAGDHSHRSANLKATNEEGKGSKNVLEESPSSSAFPNTSQAFKGQMPFDKTSSKSRSISDKTEKEKFHESVRKDDVDETKKKDDGLAPGKNYNTEDKGNGNVSLEYLESIKGISKAYQFKTETDTLLRLIYLLKDHIIIMINLLIDCWSD